MILATGKAALAVLKVALIVGVNCSQWEQIETVAWRTETCAHIEAWQPAVYFDVCKFDATMKTAPDLKLTLDDACSYVHPDSIGPEK
jgi:hypothetical protein